jgi:hypothetical protein
LADNAHRGAQNGFARFGGQLFPGQPAALARSPPAAFIMGDRWRGFSLFDRSSPVNECLKLSF